MIEVKTKYNLETHREFLRFLFFRGKYYRYKQQAFSILGALLIVLWVVFYFLLDCGPSALLLLAVGIVVILWATLVPFILSRQNAREASKLSQNGLDVIFDDDRVSVMSDGEGPDKASLLRYKDIYHAYEAKNDFYIFITREHAFIVSKKDFIPGDAAGLRGLLRAKLGKEFVICK